MRVTVSQLGGILGGTQPVGEDLLLRAAIDSRAVHPGDLFVCIPGQRVDGHDFAGHAEAAGATAILASRPLPGLNIPVFLVDDTVAALGGLAAWHRERASAKVVCLTGTAGKTTLKDTIAGILGRKAKVVATEKNHNNQIGLPLTILAANGDEDFWILEAGINHPGDMDYLGSIARPDLAVILNIGPGHIEGLGGKGVAWNKTRLLKYLTRTGEGLVCADYPQLLEESQRMGVKLHLFSVEDENVEFYAREPGGDDREDGLYELNLRGKIFRIKTPFMGRYGMETALCASAATCLLGLSDSAIQEGFAGLALPSQRFTQKIIGGMHIFDSTYNANPLSMRRMLEAASQYARKRNLPFVAALGEMGELGDDSGEWHKKLGGWLSSLHPAAIFWKGDHGDDVKSGLDGKNQDLINMENPEEFPSSFAEVARACNLGEAVILFMGSRSNRLEQYLDALLEKARERTENVL